MSIQRSDQFSYAENQGRKIYQGNQELQEISNLMEHPLFRTIYDKYFNDMTSIQLIMMVMKIYEEIEQLHPEFSGYQKLYFVKKILDDRNLRSELVVNWQRCLKKQVNNIINNKNASFRCIAET